MNVMFTTARNTFSGISMLLGCLFTVVHRPDFGSWSPLTRLHDHTCWTHHSQLDCSEWVNSLTQRPLPATHNTHKRQTSMPLAGFEPTIPAIEWPQTRILYHVTTGTSMLIVTLIKSSNGVKC